MCSEKRDKQIHIRVTKGEYKIILQKLKDSKLRSLTDFFLKTLLESKIFVIDMTPIAEIEKTILQSTTTLNNYIQQSQYDPEINLKVLADIYNSLIDILKELRNDTAWLNELEG